MPSSSTIVLNATCELVAFSSSEQLDVRELRAADRPLLLLDRQRIPRVEVVDVLLHDDVAAARERRVLVADQDRRRGRGALGILGAVDEPEQVALVE